MARIIGVHGVGNFLTGQTPQRAAAHLARTWHAHLRRKAHHPEPRHQVAVAYYADLLRSGRQSGAVALSDLSGFEMALFRAWMQELSPPEDVAAGWGTWAPRQMVAWLAQSRLLGRAATEWFVATFVREVAAYLGDRDSPARSDVRERVAAAAAAHGADVMIAHSLGAVVAYETLWEYPDLPVKTLLTLGAPLALPHAVHPRLDPQPANGRGRRPPGVRLWINLADPGDFVAIPPHGVGKSFDGVHIDEHTVIGAFDFHLVKNYLAAPRLHHEIRRL